MRTYANPVKKTNFEENELRARKQKANKSQRSEGKKMINKMIEEDEEIRQAYVNQQMVWDVSSEYYN